jgi:plastocyanin domain-containing protein
MSPHKLFTPLLVGLMLTLGLVSGCASKPAETAMGPDGVQTVKVVVQGGYQPNHIVAKADKPLRIEFYRDEDPGAHSCVEELAIPEENVKIHLPARESQIVEIKPHKPGEMTFQCGMDMVQGKITFQ